MTEPSTMGSAGRRSHLPGRRTSFVGRQRELEEVQRALAEARMVTLTGAGGCGKTSLALEAAREAADDFPDGTWLAALAPISDPTLVAATVAVALGVLDEPGRSSLDALGDALQGKRLLLVVDNCEHVLDAASELCDELLRRCPELRILATSREALGIGGEHRLPVPPLGFPTEDADARAVAGSEAGELFLDRARAVLPGIRIDEGNAEAVVRICRRLDGIPLAIELAAARIGFLTPQEIAERLDDRFRLLRGSTRAALPRHRTLRALIDWSHDLLNEQEAILYRRLGVFVGGCTFEAAERVCSADPLGADDVLDLLGRLVEKSLVRTEEHEGRTRYGMLETVREHALDRLRASGEEGAIRLRHLAWCSSFVEWAETELAGSGRGETALTVEREFGNVRAAIDWSLESGDIESTLRLLPHRRFWQATQAHGQEARAWVEVALARADNADRGLRAAVLATAGEFQRVTGDPDRATEYLEQALAVQREVADGASVGRTLYMLGRAESTAGHDERARAITEESLALARAANDTLGLGEVLAQLGEITYNRRDPDRARPLLEESLEVARETGDAHTAADSLRVLGMIERDAGHAERARRCLDEALDHQRALADWACASLTLSVLGDLALREGRPADAHAAFAESLSLLRRVDNRSWMGDCVWGLAAVAAAQGHMERAARLLGVEEALRQRTGTPFRLASMERRDEVPSTLRELMGTAAFDIAWQQGKAMRQDEALDDALGDREAGVARLDGAAPTLGAPEAGGGWSAGAVEITEADAAVLRREGEYWSVAFERTAFRLHDSKGLRYLARLLGSPGMEIHALDLVGAAAGSDGRRAVLGDAGAILDPQAKAAYRRRMHDLREELQEAESWNDPERASRASEELEFLAGELSAATGLGGRNRKAASASERARVNVTRALRSALARIAVHAPALGAHLQATIRTGTFCSYVPDPRVPLTWRL